MNTVLAAQLRRWLKGDERLSAATVVRRELAAACEPPARAAFRSEMHQRISGGAPRTYLGDADDGTPYVLPVASLGRHMLITGASGAGKSFGLLRLLLPLLPEALLGRRGIVFADPKGELSELLPPLLAAMVLRLPPMARGPALRRIRVVDPFDAHALPPLDILVSPPGLDEGVHLRQVVGSLAQATANLGIRQSDALYWLLRLAREHGVPFPLLPELLNNSYLREALASRASADVRSYFHGRFTTEAHVTTDGLGARIDAFLALRATRLCLAAGRMLDLGDALNEGVTIINLGRAPGGVRSVQSFFGLMLSTQLVQAAFARPNTQNQPPGTLVFDDVAELLLQDIALDLERTLVLLRSRRVNLIATTQELAQLTAITPLLRSAFLTNAAVWWAFRAGPHDDHALSLMLRPTGRRLRPAALPWESERAPVFMSRSEEEQCLLREATELPARVAFVWDRATSFGPIRVRTAALRIPREGELPAPLLAAVRRGSVAIPIPTLEARLARERERLHGLVREREPERERADTRNAPAESAPEPQRERPRRTRRRRRPDLPDLG